MCALIERRDAPSGRRNVCTALTSLTLTECPRHFDAMGGQEESCAVAAAAVVIVIDGAAVAVVVAAVVIVVNVAVGRVRGEALFPVVRVCGEEGVLAGGVAAVHRVADEAPDTLGHCNNPTFQAGSSKLSSQSMLTFHQCQS